MSVCLAHCEIGCTLTLPGDLLHQKIWPANHAAAELYNQYSAAMETGLTDGQKVCLLKLKSLKALKLAW